MCDPGYRALPAAAGFAPHAAPSALLTTAPRFLSVTLRLFATRGFAPSRAKPAPRPAAAGLCPSRRSIRAAHDGPALLICHAAPVRHARLRSVSAQSPGRCAPLRPASLRSKLPRRPLLRTSYSTSDGAEYTRPPNSLLSMYRPLASPPNSSILVMRSQAFFSSSPCSFTNQSKNWTVR